MQEYVALQQAGWTDAGWQWHGEYDWVVGAPGLRRRHAHCMGVSYDNERRRKQMLCFYVSMIARSSAGAMDEPAQIKE